MASPFKIEKIRCCVCGGSGRIKRAILFSRSCAVCSGDGVRKIIVPAEAEPDVQESVRRAASQGRLIGGLNG